MPFAFFVFLIFLRKLLRGRILGLVFWGGVLGLFVWVRWVEPQQIVVQETVIDAGWEQDIVLIADMHLGIYKDERYLYRVVDQINQLEDIDAVMIAGDFTYEPTDISAGAFEQLFRPLSYIDVPVLAVLGNHDVEAPGQLMRQELVQALDTHGVIFLQNDRYLLGDTIVVGLGSHMAGEDQVSLLDTYDSSEQIIVLTHNPDTVSSYRNDNADVTLVGHTHCGQIRLPWVHKYVRPYTYPVVGDFDCGLVQHAYTQLYITPGLGEVLLPMRFRNPPTIDILRLR